jgi:2-polyprenyl-3-methyl-5-hydroxy-6-metoxy-1,4-benzoquinol methylase
VCGGLYRLHHIVDFSHSCESRNGLELPKTDSFVEYHECENCGTIHAPTFDDWTDEEFSKHIYNDEYIKVDPEYVETRPSHFVNEIENRFSHIKETGRHLDYGGGNGFVSDSLVKRGWNSTTYDPYGKTNTLPEGKFGLITAFEVFEHAQNPHRVMTTILSLLEDNGVLYASTALFDKHESHMGWYIAPRNGHITIYTRKGMSILAKHYGLEVDTDFSADSVKMWKILDN